ncbi:MAG: AAA family ATPase [Eubacteriales bacterium]|nr:AAA family ATPase [Eubacteriales bacterium]
MSQVIAVVSGKGGTGKTSFVSLTGAALSQLGKKTLVLDCDIGLRNLDLYLGLSDRALMDFRDVIAGRTALADAAVQHPRYPNLYLLTAPVRCLDGEIQSRDFAALLQTIREQFDFCLIDASAGLGSAFRLATGSADRVIVVTTSDPSSLRDAQRTVMELHRFPQGRLHLVVNRVRRKLLKSLHTTIDDAIDTAGLPLLGVIPEDENVPSHLGRGDLAALNSYSGASRACHNIARRICGGRVALMKL